MIRLALIFLSLFLIANTISAQTDTIKYALTLEDVVDMAITQSSAVKYVKTQMLIITGVTEIIKHNSGLSSFLAATCQITGTQHNL